MYTHALFSIWEFLYVSSWILLPWEIFNCINLSSGVFRTHFAKIVNNFLPLIIFEKHFRDVWQTSESNSSLYLSKRDKWQLWHYTWQQIFSIYRLKILKKTLFFIKSETLFELVLPCQESYGHWKRQKQLPEVFYNKKFSWKFHKMLRKTPVPESLF